MPKPSLSFFLDSCILFDAIEDSNVKSTLRHCINDGHSIFTSLTVMGEIVMVSFNKNRRMDLNKILDLCGELDVNFLTPNLYLRACCACIDQYLEEEDVYGSSPEDRTHLAYANVYHCDYFVTSESETKTLKIPCKESPTSIISINEMKSIL